MSLLDFILRFIPPAARVAAFSAATDVEVVIDRNAFGGWSIFAANDHARRLLGGDEPTGNFATYAHAYARAYHHNCWTVVEAATLPGLGARKKAA